jgi:hypothetical protein
MKQLLTFAFTVALSITLAGVAHGDCGVITSEGPPYGLAITEDFNTLVATGSSATLPIGWLLSESGPNANNMYMAGNGSDATGDTYSFGSLGSTNRTFGGLRSGVMFPTLGACFKNQMTSPLRYFSIAYKGKKWRAGQTTGGDKLVFEYSVDATFWTPVTQLDYTSPASPAIGPVDGNSVFTQLQRSFGPRYIPPGGILYLRWTDLDVTGEDDGLGIDDFYLAPYISLGSFVDVGGRVTSVNGAGIQRARVTLSYPNGAPPQTALTSTFGYYNFPESVEAGTSIVLCVSKKGYTFVQPCRAMTVFDTVTDADFVAEQGP